MFIFKIKVIMLSPIFKRFLPNIDKRDINKGKVKLCDHVYEDFLVLVEPTISCIPISVVGFAFLS